MSYFVRLTFANPEGFLRDQVLRQDGSRNEDAPRLLYATPEGALSGATDVAGDIVDKLGYVLRAVRVFSDGDVEALVLERTYLKP